MDQVTFYVVLVIARLQMQTETIIQHGILFYGLAINADSDQFGLLHDCSIVDLHDRTEICCVRYK
jgi:hypothetical protein